MAPTLTSLTSYHYAKVMHWLGSQLRLFTGSAPKILWCIADKTFGFRKWEDIISYSQFETYCDICRDTAIATIKDLLTLNIIRRRRAGNSYAYALILPADLFVDKSQNFSTHNPQQSSFFTQNSEDYPPSDEQMVEKFDTQIKDVTSLGNGWNRVVEILNALTTINDTAPTATYSIRNLPRWAKRAATLGMTWGDVWTLWRSCQRIGRNPIALFLSRLMDDGALPIAKATPRPKPLSKKERLRLSLVAECRAACA